jgi:hypothetical protein
MMGRLSRNPEHWVANTGGNPKNGRCVCRAVQPVMLDESILVVDGPGPVGFKGPVSQHTTLAWSSPKTGGRLWPQPINRLLRHALHSVSYGRVSEAVAWVSRAMVIRGR